LAEKVRFEEKIVQFLFNTGPFLLHARVRRNRTSCIYVIVSKVKAIPFRPVEALRVTGG
jgi:hypothetical protein